MFIRKIVKYNPIFKYTTFSDREDMNKAGTTNSYTNYFYKVLTSVTNYNCSNYRVLKYIRLFMVSRSYIN